MDAARSDERDPHAGHPAHSAGPAPERAAATIVFVHGRGGSAAEMLELRGPLGAADLAAVAPQAAGRTWYPHSFLAPLAANQPDLDSALRRLGAVVDALAARGVPPGRVVLIGFSQGACLALEFAARDPRPYGAVIGLTGGLIGPPGTPRDYPGSLAGVPVFLGAGDPDPHVPFARVEETRDVLTRMGAAVDLRRYPGMPHTINEDESDACRQLIRRVAAADHSISTDPDKEHHGRD